jgi:hypothetical protein
MKLSHSTRGSIPYELAEQYINHIQELKSNKNHMRKFCRRISAIFVLRVCRQHSGKQDIKNRLLSPLMSVVHILVQVNGTHSLLTYDCGNDAHDGQIRGIFRITSCNSLSRNRSRLKNWFIIFNFITPDSIIIIIIIIIFIIIIISFMQGIYKYIPEGNNVPREYIVAAILLLLFMVPKSLVPALDLLYFYFSTFRSLCIAQYGCFL